MAISPSGMLKQEEVNWNIVKQLEMEADNFLNKQPKGLNEYMIIWNQYYSLINLKAVAKLYQDVGWITECKTDGNNQISSIKLKLTGNNATTFVHYEQ